MSRRKSSLTNGNLDALMDTLTNVVGILIIILILVQVGVGQSMKRIVSELPQVSPEELQRIREDAADQRAKHAQLRELIEKQKLRADVERNELAKLNPQLTTLETTAQRGPVTMLDMATIRGKNLDNGKEVDALRRQMAELLAEQQKLKAALDTTPAIAPPADKIVRIPNSRPLAETAKMERFLVTDGHIYGYDPEGAKKVMLQEFQNARLRLEKEKTKAPDGSTQVVYDQDKVVKFFQQRRITYKGLEVRVPYNQTGTRLTMELVPRTDAGETIETAMQFTSRFQSEIRQLKSANTIAWFNVAKGGFDGYLQLREVCESVGTAAGWEMVSNTVVSEPITEFDVNQMVQPPPPRTPDPLATPRPRAATPVPMPKASPPPAPIKIDPPKKKLD